MRLHPQLSLLVVGTVAPVLLLAVVAGVLLVRHERNTMEEEAIGRTRSAMSAVDALLRGHLTTLQALAASRALEAGNIRAFYEETRRVLRAQPEWLNVGLASADGIQLFDAVRPFGTETPLTGDLASYRLAVERGMPVIGDVDEGIVVPDPSVRIRLPVVLKGSVRYVLTLPLKPDAFSDVLRAQRLPESWVIALVDRNRRFIARLPPMAPGRAVAESFRAAIERSPNGWFPGSTLEGTRTYTPYVTSELSGWVLGIAIPARSVEAAATRTFFGFAAGIATVLALALLLGWYMARRIASPIAALAAATEAMGQGKDVRVADPGRIDEISRLYEALRAAAAAVRERSELQEREKTALQAADRSKDEFLAMLSHELRNPLAALTAAAHVLKFAQPGDQAAAKARAVVERQTKHMARLVGDLLDISRVAMGKVALERERFNLAEAAGNLLNVWRASGRLERHHVSVEMKTAWVDADRARIEQVLSNLLDNAVKFTPAGRRIAVRVGPEGEWAQLCVSDEGEGLAPGSAERMFDLFVQGERGLDRAAGGLGVGLALVKRLTEMHGGSVAGESAGPGQGATFTVRLPAVLAPSTAAAPAAPEIAPRMQPRRVLIVEDNDDTRQMLHETLAFSGHEVREARDGASGLALAAEARPDVALIDIGLPDLDGYEVARRLRAAPGGRRIGLIAITGYGQREDQRRAYEAGFDAHLTKPVAPERLKQVMAGLR
jgi:signal transduction histidine kinase/CheY-like chemotaxis protein